MNIELNIGSRVDVTPGMRMRALGAKGEPLGEIEIINLAEDNPTVRIRKGGGPFQPYGRAEGILPEKAGE